MSDVIRCVADLDRVSASARSVLYPDRLKILVGAASCGVSAGALDVESAAAETVNRLGLDAIVSRTGCVGMCRHEPIVDLRLPNGPRVSYEKMTATKTSSLLEAFAAGKDLIPRFALYRMQHEVHVAT